MKHCLCTDRKYGPYRALGQQQGEGDRVMDIGLHDVPTSREIRFAAALKAASIALPEPSLYGQEPWDLIWNVVKEADAVLDQCTPANLRAAGVRGAPKREKHT